jgi:hypothetical protein
MGSTQGHQYQIVFKHVNFGFTRRVSLLHRSYHAIEVTRRSTRCSRKLSTSSQADQRPGIEFVWEYGQKTWWYWKGCCLLWVLLLTQLKSESSHLFTWTLTSPRLRRETWLFAGSQNRSEPDQATSCPHKLGTSKSQAHQIYERPFPVSWCVQVTHEWRSGPTFCIQRLLVS